MRQERTRGSGIHRFGPFELDESERSLRKSGKRVAVLSKAFDVLTVLVRRAGRLVPKEELLRLAWPGAVVEEANIHVQLSSLRKVLGRDAITTVPGIGCRFELAVSRNRVTVGMERAYAAQPVVFHANPVGIIVTRVGDGMFLEANEAALRLYGYSREDLIGHTVADLGIYPNPEKRKELLDDIRKHGHVNGRELLFRHRSGAVGTVAVSTHAVSIGKEDCLIAMLMDVTDRKRREDEHLRLPTRESLGVLAGNLALELSDQVTAILGNVAVARLDPGDGQVAATTLAEIEKAASKARGRLQPFLAFSRAQEQPKTSQPICPLIEEVAESLRPRLPPEVELIVVLPEVSPHVRCAADQIKQSLVSLCTNAWDALEGKAGRIEIGIEQVLLERDMPQDCALMGPYARIRVTDNGCGMDEAVQDRLFEPYFTTKEASKGLGLGLAIAHSIVKAHQGMMVVHSAPGSGTAVAMYLPIVREVQKGSQRARAPTRGSGQRIAYVDDDAALALVVPKLLSRLGYRAIGFISARDAVEAVRVAPAAFDLVVSDFAMPLQSGLDLAREVNTIRSDLPVAIVTGNVTEELRKDALRAGARQVLLKPNTVQDLCQAIHRLLSPP